MLLTMKSECYVKTYFTRSIGYFLLKSEMNHGQFEKRKHVSHNKNRLVGYSFVNYCRTMFMRKYITNQSL